MVVVCEAAGAGVGVWTVVSVFASVMVGRAIALADRHS